MRGEIAVFGILALVLLGGFVWYERSRPPSQIVALVAALAAISVAGRVAFSPIPNVVPTTDITLIAGYTLGGAPGFAVGALSALVSNFWLGQGPWTPWQMAGWGLTGLAGAGLATLTGRHLGRIPLALVCALAGFAYGALLDFSLMVTYGGEQSLDRYLAISARGVPFNIAHAAGNAALALVAGPAMIRMLVRYRRRFEFAWERRLPAGRAAAAGAATIVSGLLIASATLLPARPADAAAGGPSAAVSWLRGAQNDDGGFGFGPGVDSTPVMTGWAALGLEAAGVNPLDLDHGDANPMAYLSGTVGQIQTTGDLERTILAIRGAGLDPRHFQGRDLVARLLPRQGSDGSFSGQVNQAAFGVLAMRAAGATGSIGRTAGWLREHQNSDGGWGFAAGTASDADTTGAVLQALAASGSRTGIRAGVSYLRSVQQPGGGFPLAGGAVNAQSTAYAVQGLVAAGVSPSSVRKGGGSPLDYLASVQARDGHYRYSSATDQTPVWVTGQALMAVSGKPLPLSPVPRTASGKPPSGGPSAPREATPAGVAAGTPTEPRPGPSKATPPIGDRSPAATPPAAPLTTASLETNDDGSGIPGWLIALAIVAAVGAAVWGGWVLYRRRLPG